MRPRFAISLLALLIIALAIIFLLRPQHNLTTPTSISETIQTTNQSLASNTSAVTQNIARVSPTASRLGLVIHKTGTPEEMRQRIESANVPIEFYGIFIDQDSNVLAGVKIKISIRHWTMPDLAVSVVGSKEVYLEQTSDANGRFEMHDETGDAIYVESVQKDGYELESSQRNFGIVSGNFENPIIFKMWNTNIREQLITGNKSFDIVPDGRPYFIDLTADTITESGKGDLKVWIQYTNQVVPGQLYDWSAGIEVLNGGLCSSDSYAMYEAPEDGYVPSFDSSQKIKGGQSGEIGDHRFYLLLKNGQEYGQMNINLYAPYGYLSPGLVHLSYAINPSGSRILR